MVVKAHDVLVVLIQRTSRQERGTRADPSAHHGLAETSAHRGAARGRLRRVDLLHGECPLSVK